MHWDYGSAMGYGYRWLWMVMAIVSKEMPLLRKMNGKHGYVVFFTGILVAWIIEYRKVIVLKVWSYYHFMPTIFGIGISPLFQLSITGLAAFWITRLLLYRSSSRYGC